jgi:hypothetical protein
MKQENEKELYADFRAVINCHLPWLCVDDTLWRKSACLSDLVGRRKHQLERNAEQICRAVPRARFELIHFNFTSQRAIQINTCVLHTYSNLHDLHGKTFVICWVDEYIIAQREYTK